MAMYRTQSPTAPVTVAFRIELKVQVAAESHYVVSNFAIAFQVLPLFQMNMHLWWGDAKMEFAIFCYY